MQQRGRRRLPLRLTAKRSIKALQREDARSAARARVTTHYPGPLPKLNAPGVCEAVARRLRGEDTDA